MYPEQLFKLLEMLDSPDVMIEIASRVDKYIKNQKVKKEPVSDVFGVFNNKVPTSAVGIMRAFQAPGMNAYYLQRFLHTISGTDPMTSNVDNIADEIIRCADMRYHAGNKRVGLATI